MINLIVAASINNVIGVNNTLPWKLSADMKLFKEFTTNNIVIMGRNTFESIGKPLPNRFNVILTSRIEFVLSGVSGEQEPSMLWISDFEKAIAYCKEQYPDKQIYIIGGGQIYKEAIDKKIVDRIYLTRVKTNIANGDTFFPYLDFNEWELVNNYSHSADEKNQYDFDFETWEKK